MREKMLKLMREVVDGLPEDYDSTDLSGAYDALDDAMTPELEDWYYNLDGERRGALGALYAQMVERR